MQMVSSRRAQGSSRATIAIAVLRAARRAVVSGTMPRPTPGLDHAADRVEAAQLHPQAQRPADPGRLVGEEALQGARPVEADEVVLQHLREGDLRAPPRAGWPGRDDEDEAVRPERIGGEPAGIDGAGDDADVADPLGDEADDLVGEPLLEVDAHLRVRGQEGAERLRQELRQRVGVGEDAGSGPRGRPR